MNETMIEGLAGPVRAVEAGSGEGVPVLFAHAFAGSKASANPDNAHAITLFLASISPSSRPQNGSGSPSFPSGSTDCCHSGRLSAKTCSRCSRCSRAFCLLPFTL